MRAAWQYVTSGNETGWDDAWKLSSDERLRVRPSLHFYAHLPYFIVPITVWINEPLCYSNVSSLLPSQRRCFLPSILLSVTFVEFISHMFPKFCSSRIANIAIKLSSFHFARHRLCPSSLTLNHISFSGMSYLRTILK